ncbi:acylase [Xanthomonas arboricola]|uniref:acylase n=1 Tax=Xanthomonas arboricola TaxID=56448 RepID=UPI002157841F|nr:acylase [Xanthomonas arboricola]
MPRLSSMRAQARSASLCAGLLIALFCAPQAALAGAGKDSGEILWDRYGVPHIYARTEAGTFYGFGWAQTHSHGNLLLHLYGEARGRAAEYWGEKYAEQDRWLTSNDVYPRAQQWYQQQTPGFRADLDAFAQGINDYAAAHPQALDAEVKVVLPITGVDVVAHAHRLMNYVYIASPAKVLGEPPKDGQARDGSNAWALMPSKTRDGHAMLLANPHLPWGSGFFTYYEAHLNGPGVDLYGATQVGLPILRFGFNKQLGFTNTVNTLLGQTTYKLTLSGEGYLLDGKLLPFKRETKTLKIRQADGALKEQTLQVRQSVHGPVFQRYDGSTVALRVAGLDRPDMLKQYWDMGKAQDFAQFQRALKQLQVPMFNIVYADNAGNVLFLDNGILPKHAQGDLKYWSGLVPGDTASTLWRDVHSYDELPKVINPAGGFVQNTNDPPWLASWPRVLDPKKFPAYVAPTGPMSLRAQNSVKMLAEHDSIDFDQLVALKRTAQALAADRTLPQLYAAAADSTDPDILAAVKVLKAWDRHFEADSRGALLFEEWARLFTGDARYLSQAGYATPWSLDAPLTTPSGLKDPALALRQLKQAVASTRQAYGAIDRPYGEVSRFHLGDVDVPGRGGFGNLGAFDVITWNPPNADGQRLPQHGETWVSLVEFSTPIKAKGLMSYGNASQPGSAHINDQLQLLSKGEFRTLWTTREQVEQHLESRTDF